MILHMIKFTGCVYSRLSVTLVSSIFFLYISSLVEICWDVHMSVCMTCCKESIGLCACEAVNSLAQPLASLANV